MADANKTKLTLDFVATTGIDMMGCRHNHHRTPSYVNRREIQQASSRFDRAMYLAGISAQRFH